MMTYEQALTAIHAHGRFGGKAGLERMCALLDELGNPQDQLRFVHIAGTNGKGSTAAFIASVLEQTGLNTGLFVSPYVVDFCERIRWNSQNIPQEDLCRLTERVLQAEQQLALPEGEAICEFEFTTACGMLYFAEKKCDIVVLEVGLGGRYDPTNVIKAPECAVMTHIALDHMAVLGNTVEEIAQDKSHIVKAGTTLVNYPDQTASVNEILRRRCEQIGAEYVPAYQPEILRENIDGITCNIDGNRYDLRMIGHHQAYNAATAYTVLQVLQRKQWSMDASHITAGLERAQMPARQEIVQREPLLMIDGGHNVDGVRALCETIDRYLPSGGISLVLGMVKDKQYEDCVKLLTRRADNIYTVQPEGPRALSSSELATVVRKFSPYCNVCDCGDTASGLKRALRYSEPDDVVIVCGSLYVAGEAKNALLSGMI